MAFHRSCERRLLHKHPSGDPTPSRSDVAMTREIAAAARALRIEERDHLVIGRGNHASCKALDCFQCVSALNSPESPLILTAAGKAG
jgi:DNA repair protein RadC